MKLEDALDGLSAREIEALRAKIDKRLQACVLCDNDGAIPVHCTMRRKGARFTLLMCVPCIERHRLPELRSEE